MTALHDLRREPRRPVRTPIDVEWEDRQGTFKYDRGLCTDISSGGLRMELPDPVEPLASVNFQLRELEVSGSASVRHCTRKVASYTIGVEFSSTSRSL